MGYYIVVCPTSGRRTVVCALSADGARREACAPAEPDQWDVAAPLGSLVSKYGSVAVRRISPPPQLKKEEGTSLVGRLLSKYNQGAGD